MRFILKGKAYDIDKREIEARMIGVAPEAARKYYVTVNGKEYPPKQVLSQTLGLIRVEFTTMDAASILRRLGFELKQY